MLFTVLGLKIHEHPKHNLVDDCEICQNYYLHKIKADFRALY